jgi:hypothetical protein
MLSYKFSVAENVGTNNSCDDIARASQIRRKPSLQSRPTKKRNLRMKTLALVALTTLITLSAAPSQAGGNPNFPQDRTWDLADQGANGGGAGGGGGGD